MYSITSTEVARYPPLFPLFSISSEIAKIDLAEILKEDDPLFGKGFISSIKCVHYIKLLYCINRQDKISELGTMMTDKDKELNEALHTLHLMERLLKEVKEIRGQEINSEQGETMISTKSPIQVNTHCKYLPKSPFIESINQYVINSGCIYQARIVEAVAEDEAINDCIYAMSRLLRRGRVDTDTYLR